MGASRQDDCPPRPQKRNRATGGKASVCFCLFSLLSKAAYLSVDRARLVLSSLRRQDQGGNWQSEGTKPSFNLVAPEHSGAPVRLSLACFHPFPSNVTRNPSARCHRASDLEGIRDLSASRPAPQRVGRSDEGGRRHSLCPEPTAPRISFPS